MGVDYNAITGTLTEVITKEGSTVEETIQSMFPEWNDYHDTAIDYLSDFWSEVDYCVLNGKLYAITNMVSVSARHRPLVTAHYEREGVTRYKFHACICDHSDPLTDELEEVMKKI